MATGFDRPRALPAPQTVVGNAPPAQPAAFGGLMGQFGRNRASLQAPTVIGPPPTVSRFEQPDPVAQMGRNPRFV